MDSSSQNLVEEQHSSEPVQNVCHYVADATDKRGAMTELEGEPDTKKAKKATKGKKAKKSRNVKNLTLKITKQLYDPRAEAVALPPKEEPKIGVDEDVREEAPPQVASTSGNEQELVEEVNKGEGKDQTGAKPVYAKFTTQEALAYCEGKMAEHGPDHVPTREELKELAEILDRTLHPIQLVTLFSKLLEITPQEAFDLVMGLHSVHEDVNK